MSYQEGQFLILVGGVIVFFFLAWLLIVDVDNSENGRYREEDEYRARQGNPEAGISLPRRIEANEPPSPSYQNRPNDEGPYRLEKKRYRVEVITLLSVIVYAAITFYLLKTTERATTIAQTTADASATQAARAQEGINRQIKIMRDAERAWLYIAPRDKTGIPTLKVGQPPSLDLAITNSGKTPAYDVVGGTFLEVLRLDQQPPLNEAGGLVPHNFFYSGAIVPNQPHDAPAYWMRADVSGYFARPEPRPLTQEELNALKNGQAWIAIHADLTYQDVFGQKHWIHFCSWYSPAPSGLQFPARACVAYNDTDRD